MARLTAPILMFHHVDDLPAGGPAPLYPNSYLGRAEFAALLDLLAAGGHRTLTLAEAAKRAAAGERLPRRSVVLTFDDGCRCFLDGALPELSARGMTGTLFAVTGELGGTNRWDTADGEREERLLDAEGLRAVAAAGIEIGSHGAHHRDLTALSAAELDAEISGSRAGLAVALGRPVETFCYPYGRFDDGARAAVRAAGYLAAVAIHRGDSAHAGELFALPREIVHPGDSRFEFQLKARGLYPLWSRLPRLGLLSALRRKAAA
jgi:peptidoglycan/xylan/chitin deacetylase (PgdA/CDA1 family)